MRPLSLLLFVTCLVFAASAAAADDWTAAHLRGIVLELVDGAWQPVHRNDVVPDETVIRTLRDGYVDFTRGAETVSLGPTTQVQIFDKGGTKPFTTVAEAFGTVTVDAEVENVQHFAVETPYLAAVVKGTKFTVTSGKTGTSVTVLRGHVEVDDKANKTHTLISVGQSASVGAGPTSTSSGGATTNNGNSGDGITVSGNGVLPAVVDAAGNVVGNVVGKTEGLAKGLVNGVANGLNGLTGKGGSGNGKSNGNGNAGGNGNSGNGTSNPSGGGNGNSGSGNGGLGGLLGSLGLRLGYQPEIVDTVDFGLWV